MVERVAASVMARLGAYKASSPGIRTLRWETIVVLGVVAGANLFAWDLTRRHLWTLPLALAAQAGLGLLLTLWLWSRLRRGVITPFETLISALIAFLGPMGSLGALATLLFLGLYRRNATSFEEWYAALFPDTAATLSSDIHQLIGAGRERSTGSAEVRPFIDLLNHGTPEEKQIVIALLARKFDPALASALDMAQSDGDPTIRVLAASATAAIEQKFQERWIDLRAEVERAPADPSAQFALAAHLDDYAFSGILPAQRAAEIRAQALRSYQECLQLDPEPRAVRFAVGRLLLRTGRTVEAFAIFTELQGEAGDDVDELTLAVRGFHAECLYRLGRFQDLRASLEAFADIEPNGLELPLPLRDIAGFWHARHISNETSKAG